MRIVLKRKELIAFYSHISKVTTMFILIRVSTLIPYLQKSKKTYITFNSLFSYTQTDASKVNVFVKYQGLFSSAIFAFDVQICLPIDGDYC